jgi:hypothetical protein
MKAALLKTNGEEETITPENGTDFKIEELYTLLSCKMIEVVYSQCSATRRRGMILIIDEEGKLCGKPINDQATEIYSAPFDYVVGDAIFCHTDMLK